jgi:hypothetical protein
MRRRRYLAAVGTAIGVAGCSSDTEEREPAPGGNGDDDPAPNGDAVATRTPRPAGDAEIVRTDLIRGQSIFGEIPWALVEVRNPTAAADHGEVRVQVRFYNEADELMTTRASVVGVLPADETWRYYQRLGTTNRDQLASIETSITDAEPRLRLSPPSEPEVIESEMMSDPDSGVTLTGVVEANGYSGGLELLAKVYDSEGRFRGTVPAYQPDIQPDDRWRFDVASIGIRTPQDRDQVTDHEIVLSAV